MCQGGSEWWRRGVWAVLLVCSAWPGPAAADDWLVALSPDQPAVDAQPGLAVLYPRAGLPALVAAGETMVVRVRVVAALTPPPGRQQPRALSPWKAALQGRAHAPAGAPPRHYPLAASLLRPDGGSSLIYRLSLAVPAWTAPGTYTLTLAGPGGERTVERGVRVLPAGASPRLAWFPQGADISRLSSLSALPVDAWLHAQPADDMAPAQVAGALQPVLSTAQAGVALRVGQEVLTLPPCRPAQTGHLVDNMNDMNHTGARIARDLGLKHGCLPGPRPRATPHPPITYENLDHGTAALMLPAPLSGLVGGGRPGSPPPDVALEIDLTLAVTAGGYLVRGGSLEFFPAGPPDIATDRIAARLTRHPTRRTGTGPLAITARTVDDSAATTPAIAARPWPPRAGASLALSIDALPPGARVAWQVDGRPGGFGGGAWSHRMDGSGAVEVRALVVGGDGTLRSAGRRLEVASARRSGCRLAGPAAAHGGHEGRTTRWSGLLFGLLLWRTSRRRAVLGQQ